MKSLIYIIMALFTISTIDVEAQGILDRLAKKAQQKVEQRVENKVDKTMEKQLDKIESTTEGKDGKKEKSEKDILERMANMSISNEPINYESSYSFKESMTMNMSLYNKKGALQHESKITIFYTQNQQSFGYKMNDSKMSNDQMGFSTFIFDNDNNAMLMLGEKNGQKSGIATSFKLNDTNSESDEESMVFTKTGKTKKILGYNCEEYVGNSNNTTAIYWMTKEINWQSSSFLNSSTQKNKQFKGTKSPEGMMMEADITTDTNERIHYVVTDLNRNSATKYNTSEYQISNMGTISF